MVLCEGIALLSCVILIVVMFSMWITIMSYFDCSPDDGEYAEYKVEMQRELEDTHMRRSMITSIHTVTQVSIIFRKKKKENKKMGKNIEQNTKNT
jgi:hypothetical protein